MSVISSLLLLFDELDSINLLFYDFVPWKKLDKPIQNNDQWSNEKLSKRNWYIFWFERISESGMLKTNFK